MADLRRHSGEGRGAASAAGEDYRMQGMVIAC
jgi:hypothetical protein